MNTPNKLTVLRIILVPFFVFFLLAEFVPHRYLIATLLFAIASYTDHLDGKLARKYNLISDFGKFADPLADKILVVSALMCFVEAQLISSVVVILVIAREFIVTSIRLVAVEHGKVIAANKWGKIKTVSQIVAILVVMILQYVNELIAMGIIPAQSLGSLGVSGTALVFYIIGNIFVWISTFFTILSGVIYVWDNRDFVKNAK